MICPICHSEAWKVDRGILCPKCLKFWSTNGKGLQPSYRTSVSTTDKGGEK